MVNFVLKGTCKYTISPSCYLQFLSFNASNLVSEMNF